MSARRPGARPRRPNYLTALNAVFSVLLTLGVLMLIVAVVGAAGRFVAKVVLGLLAIMVFYVPPAYAFVGVVHFYLWLRDR